MQTDSDGTKSAPYSTLRSESKRVSLAEASPLPHPFTIYLEPTNICNFKCTYCPESFDDYEEQAGGLFRMDLRQFERVCDQILELGRLKTLNFYMMGEPFVNKSLPDFIAMAKDRNVADRVIVVTSNGTLLDAKMAKRVIAAGLDYLRISIYGTTQERLTKITGTKISLDRICANVRGIYEMREAIGATRPIVYAKMIDTQDPAENQRFRDLFAGICDEAVIEPVMNWNDPDEGNLSGLETNDLLKTQYFEDRKEVCPFPFYQLVIHSDLTVSLCCVDWAKKTAIGNLEKSSLAELWRGPALRDFRLAHLRRQRHTIDASVQELHVSTHSAR